MVSTKTTREILDQNLLMSRKRIESEHARPILRATVILCARDRKAKGHSAKFIHTFNYNSSSSINWNPISTPQLDSLWLRKWNQTLLCGGMNRIKELQRSRSRTDWLIQKLKNELLLLFHKIYLSTIRNLLEVVDRVHTIYILRVPHYIGLPFWGPFPALSGPNKQFEHWI